MESLLRLGGFVWPQRKRLAVSIFAAMAAAALWALTFTLAFPIVKVLLEGQNLPAYVSGEIAKSEADAAAFTARLTQLDQELEAARQDASRLATAENQKRIREQDRLRKDLAAASGRLSRLMWADRWIMPVMPHDPFREFALILVCLACMALLKCGCEYVQETLVGGVIERALMQVRERLFRSTLQLDCQTLALEGTPQLMSRFTYDLGMMSFGLNLIGSKLVVESLKAAACICAAFYVNWRLTLLSVLCVPPAAWLLQKFGRRLKQSSQKQMETMAEIYKVLEETFSSFRVVQAFRNERLHRRRFHAANKAYFRRAYQILKLDALGNPTMEFLATCAVFLALAPGAYLVLRQKTMLYGIQLTAAPIQVADLLTLYTLLAGVLDPIRKLSGLHSRLRKAAAAADRVFAWMDRDSLVISASQPAALPTHRRQIEFERIRFHYAGAEETPTRAPALDNVSLTIPFGSVVAVVGENGSGKSTLVQLLLRFFDPQEGRVKLDGVDVRTAGLRDLRSQIGYVSQETQLFDGTIAENIRHGRPTASIEDVKRAADLAHVADFARHLPLDLQTQVGDKGSRLSGGQRQRVALARAMLRNPAIVILDEATSAIDAKSEQLIFESLREFSSSRTTLVITHRMTPELLELVTSVAVMERGRLVAFGPHETLLRTCPAYQRLSQTASFLRAA